MNEAPAGCQLDKVEKQLERPPTGGGEAVLDLPGCSAMWRWTGPAVTSASTCRMAAIGTARSEWSEMPWIFRPAAAAAPRGA